MKPIKPSKKFYYILSTILLILVGIFDYKTGYRISFMVFYFVPISVATLTIGTSGGFIFAVLSGLVWLWADFLSGHPYLYQWTPYWNALVRLFVFLLIVFILELKRSNSREKKLARTDYLTGIANRQHFYELAVREIERDRRYNHPLTVVFLDCDNLKSANDTLGHKTGDIILRTVAQTIQTNLRAYDIVARFGGDEFVILLPETGADPSAALITRIRDSLLSIMEKNTWPITFSIGVGTFMTIAPAKSIDDMIKEADDLMYVVKQNGKNLINHKIITAQK